MRQSLLGWILLMCGCAGGAAARGGSSPSSNLIDERPLIAAGPRCAGGTCRCREVDASGATLGEATDANDAAAEGQKRFELRTGHGGDEVQITVEGRGTLHKRGEDGITCGYVDLPPGEHRVRLRVKAAAGQIAAPRLLIYEHGERTHSWYGSFSMACGTGAPCTRAELADRVAELSRPRGLYDPCGSVKVKNIRQDATHDAEDRITALDLELTLVVYPFSPRFPHGGQCKGRSSTTE